MIRAASAEGDTARAREILDALRRLNLLASDKDVPLAPLTGGVSSDIWRVELDSGPVCVKRALPKLKVAQVWEAPVERNQYEYEWLKTVAGIAPAAVPKLIAHDAASGLFVMEYLSPAHHPVWKTQLSQGHADVDMAREVGGILGAIHARTAGDPALAERFRTDSFFYALRLEPYLEASARRHPDRADALLALLRTTADTRRVLVHGDVSPKNILVGPKGPILLDAECAWFGDPAFDLAFCLNHLLLKCLWVPASLPGFLESFSALAQAYLECVSWESGDALEARAAHLLPGLLLARVDGKSPVEYLTSDAQRDPVRRVARALLAQPVPRLADIAHRWRKELLA